MIELGKAGLTVNVQRPIEVFYNGKSVGEYYADMVVQDRVIVEIKAAKNLILEHESQLLNYLKATKMEVGLLLNFGPKPEFKRLAFSNTRK